MRQLKMKNVWVYVLEAYWSNTTHIQGSPHASGCPLEMIDQIGGWSFIATIGSKYGQGYDLDALRKHLSVISLS